MNETCQKASDFLQSIFDQSKLGLSVSFKETEEECVLDVDGSDAELLQAEGGELLEAVQHLVTQAFGRMLPPGKRLICDVHSFRATREAELRAMAQHAAQRVRTTGTEFMFGPMNASERRVIHLALADSQDVYTESVGQGPDRKLRVARRPLS
jgi:spoIIIJ-associated protein